MKRRTGLKLVAALSCFLPAAAQAMTVAEFLTKADTVEAKGLLAIMSADAGAIKAEMNGVTSSYRAEIDAAQKARKPTQSCPPPRGKAKLSGDDWMAWLRSVPAARRASMTVKAAFGAYMAKLYPCPH